MHRDVKPGNVLVSDMGVAKISDFGIARIELSHLTQAGEVLGTPYYMAPEQYEGRDIDERTDIYAAGVIVYEVLCGRRPYDGQGGNLMRQILQDPPPPVSTFEPRLPVTIDMVLATRARQEAGEPLSQCARVSRCAEKCVSRSAAPGENGRWPAMSALCARRWRLLRHRRQSPAEARGSGALRSCSSTTRSAIVSSLQHLFGDSYEVETATGGTPRWSACGRGASTCW